MLDDGKKEEEVNTITLMESVAQDTVRQTHSEFGHTVMALALETRNINTYVALCELLSEERAVHRQELSLWLRGEKAPPDWLPHALRNVLDLNREQSIILALTFSLGSRAKCDPSQKGLSSVEDTIRRLVF